MKWHRYISVVWALAGISITTGASSAETWRSYVNARFGTAISVPAQTFPVTGLQAENGDGATFESADGNASLSVWAYFGQDDDTPETLLSVARETSGLVKAANRKNGYWISGRSGGVAFYETCIIGAGGEQIVHCARVQYPEAQKSSYQPLTKRIGSSLSGP
jgi:hypothetical protein